MPELNLTPKDMEALAALATALTGSASAYMLDRCGVHRPAWRLRRLAAAGMVEYRGPEQTSYGAWGRILDAGREALLKAGL